MSTYSLSGSGVQALSSNVTALHIAITTMATYPGQGTANPTNYYHIALLRIGDAVGFFDAVPVTGGPQWMAVPAGATRLGYSCAAGAVISVAEVIGGTPPFGGAGALSSLSDVALASPADTQLLTYQASSGKWINANAPSGGGSGTAIARYQCAARWNTAVSMANNTSILVSWDASLLDTDSMLQVGGAHPNRITFTHAGTYVGMFQAQSTGNGQLDIAYAFNTDSTAYPGGTPDHGGAYVGSPMLFGVNVRSAADWLSLYVYMGLGSGNVTGRCYIYSIA